MTSENPVVKRRSRQQEATDVIAEADQFHRIIDRAARAAEKLAQAISDGRIPMETYNQALDYGSKGYAEVVTADGAYLFSPKKERVLEDESILSPARWNDDEGLQRLR